MLKIIIENDFLLGHDTGIISSCLHSDKIIVATGQMRKKCPKLSLLEGHKD